MNTATYTLLDAIREEAEILAEMQIYYKNKGSAGNVRRVAVEEQRLSLNRILNRFENGREYFITVTNGETALDWRQTNRHLVREYPAVAEAQATLDTVESLVGGKSSA